MRWYCLAFTYVGCDLRDDHDGGGACVACGVVGIAVGIAVGLFWTCTWTCTCTGCGLVMAFAFAIALDGTAGIDDCILEFGSTAPNSCCCWLAFTLTLTLAL